MSFAALLFMIIAWSAVLTFTGLCYYLSFFAKGRELRGGEREKGR